MKHLAPIITLILALIAWQCSVTIWEIPKFILPSPTLVFEATVSNFKTLLTAFLLTGSAALSGFLLSVALGFCCSLGFALSPWLEKGLFPFAIFFQTVPIVAIAPLLILWIGHGFWGVVTVALVISIFPIISSTTVGLTRLPASYLELFQLHHANTRQRLVKLQIPHALPHLLAGARISAGLSVIGAVVGEFSAGFGSEHFGLGYMILFSSGQLKTDLLFACIFMSTLLGYSVFISIHLAGQALLKSKHLDSATSVH